MIDFQFLLFLKLHKVLPPNNIIKIMNSLNVKKIRTESLEKASYCPVYKMEHAIENIKVDEFDSPSLFDKIKDSVVLLNYDDTTLKQTLLDIVETLGENKNKFLLNEHKYISFYLNGLLVLLIEINKDIKHNKQFHISIQKYKDEVKDRLSDKLGSKILAWGTGVVVSTALVIAGIVYFKTKS